MMRKPTIAFLGLIAVLATGVAMLESTSASESFDRGRGGKPHRQLAAPGDRAGVASETDAPPPRAQSFPLDIPAAAIALSELLPTAPAPDWAAAVVGKSDGQAVVLNLDGFELQSFYSADGGRTFGDAVVVDGYARGGGDYELSSDGYLYLAYTVADPQRDVGLRFVSSTDLGRTRSQRVQLRPESAAGAAIEPDVACGNTDRAVATWSDERTGTYVIHANRFDGSAWAGDVAIGTGAWNVWVSHAVYASNTDVVVTFEQDATAVSVSRSTDGGETFGAAVRLDDTDLNPDGESEFPEIVTDGLGNVWVSWIEGSAGEFSIAARRSSDFGATFSPVRRVNRETPQGTLDNTYSWSYSQAAAAPGTAFFAWAGMRTSWHFEHFFTGWHYDALVNAWDVDDLDRDGVPAANDCDDEDPAAGSLTVSGVRLEKITGATRLTWATTSATAVYDLASGSLGDLRSTGDFAAATCLADDHAAPPFDDGRTPTVGDGFYYLIRPQDSCGSGSYGDSTLTTDPRDGLDGSSPCP